MTLCALLLAALTGAWVLMSWARTVTAVGLAGVTVTHHAPAPAVAAVAAVILAGIAVLIVARSLRATNGRLMLVTYQIGGRSR